MTDYQETLSSLRADRSYLTDRLRLVEEAIVAIERVAGEEAEAPIRTETQVTIHTGPPVLDTAQWVRNAKQALRPIKVKKPVTSKAPKRASKPSDQAPTPKAPAAYVPRPGSIIEKIVDALQVGPLGVREIAAITGLSVKIVGDNCNVASRAKRGIKRVGDGKFGLLGPKDATTKPTGAAAHAQVGKATPPQPRTPLGDELPELGQVTAPSGKPHRVGRDKGNYRCVQCGKTRDLRGDFMNFNCV